MKRSRWRTSIEGTEATWNPVTGCDRVSAGCNHCCAMTLAKLLGGLRRDRNGAGEDSRRGH